MLTPLQVLELMREVTEEGEDEGNISDSPYHSDEGMKQQFIKNILCFICCCYICWAR